MKRFRMTRLATRLIVCILPVTALAQTNTTPDIVSATHVEILDAIGASQSQLTLVNIWATWCSPCVEEFPDIVNLESKYPDSLLSVVFVSLDFPEEVDAVSEFLREHNWTQTSYIRRGLDDDFVNGFIPEWTGAVPATFIYSDDGQLLWFKEQKTSILELERVISEVRE